MVISDEPAWGDLADAFVQQYDEAVVYGDFEQERVLHEGAARVLANGWVELPTGRLLSPEAVHHIDSVPDEAAEEQTD
jgi:hypothetical protein